MDNATTRYMEKWANCLGGHLPPEPYKQQIVYTTVSKPRVRYRTKRKHKFMKTFKKNYIFTNVKVVNCGDQSNMDENAITIGLSFTDVKSA